VGVTEDWTYGKADKEGVKKEKGRISSKVQNLKSLAKEKWADFGGKTKGFNGSPGWGGVVEKTRAVVPGYWCDSG